MLLSYDHIFLTHYLLQPIYHDQYLRELKLWKLRLLWHFIYILLKILFCHAAFSFLLFIGLYFLIPAVITHIFNPTAKLAMPIGAPTKEAKEAFKMHPVIVETKISYCLM